jgi:hypothetical protein
MKVQSGNRHISLTSAQDGDGRSTPRLARFTPGNDLTANVQETGCSPGPVWKGAKKFAHIGTRSPGRAVRSESLYRLSYPAPR